MIVIPAIDLKDGKCVRLLQGQAEQKTVYSENPVEVAKGFEKAGAKRLHLVDLDGAFKGKAANLHRIREIVKQLSIPVQLGGGIRTMQDIENRLELGLASVIIGTTAVRHPEVLEEALKKFPSECVILGIDARDGMVAVQGWTEATELSAEAFGLHWKQRGIQRVIFTDISRDGMLSGPNLEAIGNFAQVTGLAVTASGGVAGVHDIEALKQLEQYGVDQCIVGKAIYEGKIRVEEVC